MLYHNSIATLGKPKRRREIEKCEEKRATRAMQTNAKIGALAERKQFDAFLNATICIATNGTTRTFFRNECNYLLFARLLCNL